MVRTDGALADLDAFLGRRTDYAPAVWTSDYIGHDRCLEQNFSNRAAGLPHPLPEPTVARVELPMNTIHHVLSDLLPGTIAISPGAPRDYRALERFHYLPLRPATWAGVWTARYLPHADPFRVGSSEQSGPAGVGVDRARGRIIAVAVLSFPSAVQRVRHRVFQLDSLSFGQKLRWANANLRTISRVIVHPQFRSIGLAHVLIDRVLSDCPTRYVEASARMGRAHPMFERAGMHRVDPEDPIAPVYYWFDRQTTPRNDSSRVPA